MPGTTLEGKAGFLADTVISRGSLSKCSHRTGLDRIPAVNPRPASIVGLRALPWASTSIVRGNLYTKNLLVPWFDYNIKSCPTAKVGLVPN